MKRILITGAKSYIGTSFEKWLTQWPNEYHITTIDMIDGSWREHDFSKYDVVFHVAGIAHVSSKKRLAPLYFKVNRDLAIDTAIKAKNSGVKQFVFMSSMIIFGKDNLLSDHRPIDVSHYKPINAYGQSKLEADLAIQELTDPKQFITSISRTPVVYGPGCKGNFPRILRLSKYTFVVPRIRNKRSMVYIDNLCEYLRVVIDTEYQGVFYPQNEEWVSTNDIIANTRAANNKKTYQSRILAGFIWLLSFLFPFIRKIYGDKYYGKDLPNPPISRPVQFIDSIRKMISQ